MKKSQLPRAPAGLTDHGRAIWRRYVAEFSFTAPELELLELLCQQHDRIAEAQQSIAVNGVIIEDARGSKKTNPACRVEQQAAALALRLTRALKLLEPAKEDGVQFPTIRASGKRA